jgi:hypothetical protein
MKAEQEVENDPLISTRDTKKILPSNITKVSQRTFATSIVHNPVRIRTSPA